MNFAKNTTLTVCGLGCERNHRTLFQDLNFQVNPGEIWQIDGANGAGKTTLLRMLCGLLYPDEGDVRWCERPIMKTRAEYFAELVFVGHKNGIKDELTALENLDFERSLVARASPLSLPQALRQLGLDGDGLEIQTRFLSAGQRRRVALARLLIGNAQLWVLDEPLTALDKRARHMIGELLSKHAGRGGMAVITTHQDMTLDAHSIKKIQLG